MSSVPGLPAVGPGHRAWRRLQWPPDGTGATLLVAWAPGKPLEARRKHLQAIPGTELRRGAEKSTALAPCLTRGMHENWTSFFKSRLTSTAFAQQGG